MIGPAVDEAAAWHENAEWFGCILSPSALLLNVHKDLNAWVEYEAPVKKGGKYLTGCINWIDTFQERNEKNPREKICVNFTNMGSIIPEISQKYTNTLRFFDKFLKEKTTVC